MCFPDFKQTSGKEYITFILSSSSRAIEQQKKSEWIRKVCRSNWYKSVQGLHKSIKIFQGLPHL